MNPRKKVIVTGASSGIGWATAMRFANDGWDVCALARREEQLQKLLAGLPHGDHFFVAGDYSESGIVHGLGEAVISRWGKLDALVNCAGAFQPASLISSQYEDWRRPLHTMLDGAVRMTRLAAPLMQTGGRVIHVTSIHAGRAEANASAYAMAKAAIDALCRAIAVELAPQGILANAIAPGFIETPMSVVNGVNELESEWFKANYASGHHLPLRRAGTPDEIAGVAAFLAGQDASYITGQVLTVDGGLTVTF